MSQNKNTSAAAFSFPIYIQKETTSPLSEIQEICSSSTLSFSVKTGYYLCIVDRMGSGTTTSWADGWNKHEIQLGGKRSKMESIKAAAALGLCKAKAAVLVGGHKMKKSTSTGSINWIKTQYHRKTSK